MMGLVRPVGVSQGVSILCPLEEAQEATHPPSSSFQLLGRGWSGDKAYHWADDVTVARSGAMC